MEKISTLIKAFQAYQATGSPENMLTIKEIVSKIPVDTGVVRATAHRVDLEVVYRGQIWDLRLLPTFHGVEVKVLNKDFGGAKSELSKFFRDTFPMAPSPLDIKSLEAISLLLDLSEGNALDQVDIDDDPS